VPPHTAEIRPAFEGGIVTIVALRKISGAQDTQQRRSVPLLACASDALNEPRLVALVDAPNLASRALMQRCGFREIGAAQGPYPVAELIA
jgi:L-amino acid N-acyltransferase YncA